MNKTEKVLKSLRENKSLTPEQLRKEVGFTNVSKYVRLLRENGHIILVVQSTRTDAHYEYQGRYIK